MPPSARIHATFNSPNSRSLETVANTPRIISRVSHHHSITNVVPTTTMSFRMSPSSTEDEPCSPDSPVPQKQQRPPPALQISATCSPKTANPQRIKAATISRSPSLLQIRNGQPANLTATAHSLFSLTPQK
ncbi:hypothetical protein MLD38_034549 [Melastoma candidum]|uniref:Uncharacterized protein n=1 Tax=Melastoma candidum TaxID=119954 RepID=A0ACB9MCT7_9MYRT|nr:hypothetical protein MLD38_034549 [Melastoma candidum]